MKICVFGAGAIGGYIGCSLSKAGANVSLIARGPHREAIEENGVELFEKTEVDTSKNVVFQKQSCLKITHIPSGSDQVILAFPKPER